MCNNRMEHCFEPQHSQDGCWLSCCVGVKLKFITHRPEGQENTTNRVKMVHMKHFSFILWNFFSQNGVALQHKRLWRSRQRPDKHLFIPKTPSTQAAPLLSLSVTLHSRLMALVSEGGCECGSHSHLIVSYVTRDTFLTIRLLINSLNISFRYVYVSNSTLV